MKPFSQLLLTASMFFIFGWLIGNSKQPEREIEENNFYYTKDSIQYVPKLESETHTSVIENIKYIDTSSLDQAYIDSVLKNTNNKQLVYVADDYFKKRFYSDTFGDSNYTLILSDSVWKNQLIWKGHNISVRHKETIITKKQRPYLSLGVFGGYSNQHQSLGGMISYTTKNKLSIGYGFSPFGSYHTMYISKGLILKK